MHQNKFKNIPNLHNSPPHRPLTPSPTATPNTSPQNLLLNLLQPIHALSRTPLHLPPLCNRPRPRPLQNLLLLFLQIQIAPLALRTLAAGLGAKVLAEMHITRFAYICTTDVAHCVAADADEFVAAGGFDEGEVALRAGSFDRGGDGGVDVGLEREPRRGVAGV